MSKDLIVNLAENGPVQDHSYINKGVGRLFGVELEIENVNWPVEGICSKQMTVTTDGSLRNNGYEYITKPMNIPSLSDCLQLFFKRTGASEKNYSERCSVHVHVNCQDLTISQLYSILLLYQVVERLFYRWVGDNRDENIFCVPWHQTNLPNRILNNKALTNIKKWQKYSGLNLLPINTYGTIEFRHMAGTHDWTKIIKWCEFINSLFTYGAANSMEDIKAKVLSLNSNSMYDRFLYDVFGDDSRYFMHPAMRQELEQGVLDTKFIVIKEMENPKTSKKSIDGLHDALQFVANNQQAGSWIMNAVPPPLQAQGDSNFFNIVDDIQ